MIECKVPNEDRRIAALRYFEILDTPAEEPFERITRLAKTITQAPIVLISLVDEFRQWFKSKQGLDIDETPRDVSFCAYTIGQPGPMVIEDARLDQRFANNPLVTGEPHIRFYAGVPLRTRDGYNIGTICVIDTKPRQLDAKHIAVLQDLARLVIDEMELRLVAAVDSLSGALSRRAFCDAARRDIAQSIRKGTSLCLAMIDIDHFKILNDKHGHAAGDLAIQNVVSVCKDSLRESDYIGRVGGEEFAVMMPNASYSHSFDLAERLRSKIEEARIESADGPLRVTVSIGVTASSRSISSIEELMRQADAAMYLAKQRGRNSVISFQECLSDERLRPIAV